MSKKPEVGLTEQLELLAEMEEKEERKALKKYYRRAVKHTKQLVKEASEHLEHENSTKGAELIAVLNPSAMVLVTTSTMFYWEAELAIGGSLFAAWVNGTVAIVPELGTLAVPTKHFKGPTDVWATVEVEDLYGAPSAELVRSDMLDQGVVSHLNTWLESLLPTK